jgi:hypothetical protein
MRFEAGLGNWQKSLKRDIMGQNQRPPRALVLSAVAGILIICNAVAVGVAVTWFPWIFPTLPGSENNSAVPFTTITIVGLVCGVLVLLGTLLLYYKPLDSKAIGLVIIGFSIPSVLTGGGFIIGFILGIIGGVKALRWKSETRKTTKMVV